MFKIKREIDDLIKKGIPEEFATIIVYTKYNKEEDESVKYVLEQMKEENEMIERELSNFISISNINESTTEPNDTTTKKADTDIQC